MIEAGHYLWNASIFLFKTHDMITAFEAYAPDLLKPVTASLMDGCPDLGFFRLAPETWSQCADISVDYAVMEQENNYQLCPILWVGQILVLGMLSGKSRVQMPQVL